MTTIRTIFRFKACRKIGIQLWPWRGSTSKQLKLLKSIAKRKKRIALKQSSRKMRNPTFFIVEAKRIVRFLYGRLPQKYLTSIFEKSLLYKGNIAAAFFILLEKRLDVTLYRVYFVTSVQSARQLISHKHVLVNGIVMTDPGFLLKPGDSVSLTQNAAPRVMNAVQNLFQTESCMTAHKMRQIFHHSMHLEVNYRSLTFVYLFTPQQLHYPVILPVRHVKHAFQR
jgi:ribosomal protein S4